MKTQFRPAPKGHARWVEAPARYTVIRLSDRAERYTDRMPRVEVRRSPAFMVWDNQEKREVRA